MANTYDQLNFFKHILNNFNENRAKLVQFLHNTATELGEHHKNIKITKVVTGSTAIAGTLMGVGGVALALPTGGISLALTLGGGLLAATSGVAHLGSGIVENILEKRYIDELDKLSRADEEYYLGLNTYLEERLKKLHKNASKHKMSIETRLDLVKELSWLSGLGCSLVRVTQITSTAARSIRIFGAASAVFGKTLQR